jgi:hypothetical protein
MKNQNTKKKDTSSIEGRKFSLFPKMAFALELSLSDINEMLDESDLDIKIHDEKVIAYIIDSLSENKRVWFGEVDLDFRYQTYDSEEKLLTAFANMLEEQDRLGGLSKTELREELTLDGRAIRETSAREFNLFSDPSLAQRALDLWIALMPEGFNEVS